MVRVKPELRRLIDFMSVNLIRDDWPFKDPSMWFLSKCNDLFRCRNSEKSVGKKFIESLSLEGFYLWDMRKILASLKTCLSCAEKRFTSGADSVW